MSKHKLNKHNKAGKSHHKKSKRFKKCNSSSEECNSGSSGSSVSMCSQCHQNDCNHNGPCEPCNPCDENPCDPCNRDNRDIRDNQDNPCNNCNNCNRCNEESCDNYESFEWDATKECKKIVSNSASINCLQVNDKLFYDGHFIEVDDIIPPKYITSVVNGNTHNPPIQPALILPTAIPIPQGVFVPVSLPVIGSLPNFVSILSTEIPSTICNNFGIKTITSKIFIQNTSTSNVDVAFGLYLYTRSNCGELLEPLDLSIATVIPSQVQSFDVYWDQSKNIGFPSVSQYPSDIVVFAIFTTVMIVGVQSTLSSLQTYKFPYEAINYNIKLTR